MPSGLRQRPNRLIVLVVDCVIAADSPRLQLIVSYVFFGVGLEVVRSVENFKFPLEAGFRGRTHHLDLGCEIMLLCFYFASLSQCLSDYLHDFIFHSFFLCILDFHFVFLYLNLLLLFQK